MIQTLLLNGLELIDRFLVRETKGAVGSVELVFSSSSSTLSPPLNCFCNTGNIRISYNVSGTKCPQFKEKHEVSYS